MRTNFTLSTMAMGVAILFASCSKSSQEEMVISNPAPEAAQVINSSILSNATYQLTLSSATMKIYKQAAHFTESAIGKDSKTGLVLYKYTPESDFTGQDEVTLSDTKTYTSGSGRSCNNSMNNESQTVSSTSFITIKFKIIK